MGVNLYNREGYVDSTAYEAISNVEQEKKQEYQKKHCKKEMDHKITVIRYFEGNQPDNS